MAQLPQHDFLWKVDVKYLKQKISANVLVKAFFPQRDLLAHPKLKAFVTHCGGLSSQEALWRRVPMIGVQLFIDRHRIFIEFSFQRNFRLSVHAGVMKKVDFLAITTDDLRETIKTIAEDPTIRANANAKAVQFRDRPMKPLDTAVWWVEYLLQNPNSSHLKSPAAKLNIFQVNSLDCLLVLCIVFMLLIYLTVMLLSLVWKTCKKREKMQNATKRKIN